jgi:UDP-2,4-diacetamido-2,4,6-trideoxy-beta-L-altropyranose hydrolase
VSIRTLLIRADASTAIGTGHVMRCLALAQAWQDAGGRAVFAMAESTHAVQTRLAAESCDVLQFTASTGTADDLRQTIALAKERNCEWVVVDGYQFEADYQQSLKAANIRVLFLDDCGQSEHYFADLVLNQNLSATEALYNNREPNTQLLLGTRYCLLRREFSAWREWKRKVSPAGHRVLVTMGGSDPENLSARVIDALMQAAVDDLEAIVVMGGSSSLAVCEERLPESPGKKIRVLRDVTNIAELMAWADVAVSSAGSTCWELCLLGLPSLLIDVAENQRPIAQELNRRQCAIHLGSANEFTAPQLANQLGQLLRSAEVRQSVSIRCRELVDGKGAWRVLSVIRPRIHLRRVRENDKRLLWEWANDPEVRAAAFSQAAIPWEQHETWFANKIDNPNCLLLIGEDEPGRAVGQFRVDWISDQEGEIDVSVSSELRGAGYGKMLIEGGVSRAFAERGERLHAFVKAGNEASRHAFEGAGFIDLGEEITRGHRCTHYIFLKGSTGTRSE